MWSRGSECKRGCALGVELGGGGVYGDACSGDPVTCSGVGLGSALWEKAAVSTVYTWTLALPRRGPAGAGWPAGSAVLWRSGRAGGRSNGAPMPCGRSQGSLARPWAAESLGFVRKGLQRFFSYHLLASKWLSLGAQGFPGAPCRMIPEILERILG